jgi:hypothetical protein
MGLFYPDHLCNARTWANQRHLSVSGTSKTDTLPCGWKLLTVQRPGGVCRRNLLALLAS